LKHDKKEFFVAAGGFKNEVWTVEFFDFRNDFFDCCFVVVEGGRELDCFVVTMDFEFLFRDINADPSRDVLLFYFGLYVSYLNASF
jgi:hypothetical protein